MNKLRLISKGFFAGQFIVTTNTESFSIGDYIEVNSLQIPYIENRIWCFPLLITFSSMSEEMEVKLLIPSGRQQQHWKECLKVGTSNVVRPAKFEFKKFVGYMPVINGWRPGMFGKVE